MRILTKCNTKRAGGLAQRLVHSTIMHTRGMCVAALIFCLHVCGVPTSSFFTPSAAYAANSGFSGWISPTTAAHLTISDLKRNASHFSSVQALLYRATCHFVKPYSAHTPSAATIVPLAHSLHMRTFITVQGNDAAGAAINCWNNQSTLSEHVSRLVSLATSTGADGIDIDYETAYFGANASQVAPLREGYVHLMSQLCGQLHRLGKQCSIAVVPTFTGRMGRNGHVMPFLYDYSRLAQIADRVEIMAYDQHTRLGAPGPIAGIPWLESIARYAARTMPAQKVWIGLPLYGRDWVGNHGSTLKHPNIEPLLARSDIHPHFDAVQGEMTFRYGPHIAWFPDAASISAKLAVVRSYGFHAAFWSLGQEIPGTWDHIY